MNNVAINGFGRIGRSILRIIVEQDLDINVVAINDLGDYDNLAYLFKHDSIMGVLDADISVTKDLLKINNRNINLISISDPSELPWKELNVEIVIESTGIFTDNESLNKHINAGAKKVLLTVPPKDEVDATIVLGVNDDILTNDSRLISNASCTTNCLAPIANIVHENFKIEKGFMTTIHSFTTDQRILDNSHKDIRRARTASQSIVPTSTGASKAIGEIIPSLKGKLEGVAMRIPTPNVSLIELIFCSKKDLSVEKINSAFKNFSKKQKIKVLEITEEKLVSIDFNHNPASSIVDASLTNVIGKNMGKISAWYDNEWGFSNRMCDIAAYLHKIS